MKVLVDTNIWIDFVNTDKNYDELIDLISSEQALTHILVEAELRSGSKFDTNFIDIYKTLEEAKFVNFPIVFQFIEKEKLYGKGLSYIDISLYASARMGEHLIWTHDKNLKKLCESKNILYKEAK